MIPKIIHFCWFGGGKYPREIKDCLDTWEKILLSNNYQIICWDEANFDIHCNLYVEQAYERKKWAFVSDYLRLWALYHYGGIYLDCDVRVLKSLDRFLQHDFFACYENKSVPRYIQTGVIGAKGGHPFVKAFIDDYSNRIFINESGEEDTTTNVVKMTELAQKLYGFVGNGEYQWFGEDIHIYPYDYFSGFRGGGAFGDKSLYDITENTYTIHEFAGSWLPKKKKFYHPITKIFSRFYK